MKTCVKESFVVPVLMAALALDPVWSGGGTDMVACRITALRP
jgi:hypothetical protein